MPGADGKRPRVRPAHSGRDSGSAHRRARIGAGTRPASAGALTRGDRGAVDTRAGDDEEGAVAVWKIDQRPGDRHQAPGISRSFWLTAKRSTGACRLSPAASGLVSRRRRIEPAVIDILNPESVELDDEA